MTDYHHEMIIAVDDVDDDNDVDFFDYHDGDFCNIYDNNIEDKIMTLVLSL